MIIISVLWKRALHKISRPDFISSISSRMNRKLLTEPSISTKLLRNVDGSAQWEVGITKVICSVTGPMEAKVRDELPSSAALEIVVRPIVGLTSKFQD